MTIESCKLPQIGTGDLVLHQFGLSISLPNGHEGIVDVMGLGPERESRLNAPWHEVVDVASGILLNKADARAKAFPTFATEAGNIRRYKPVEIDLPSYMNDGTNRRVSRHWS